MSGYMMGYKSKNKPSVSCNYVSRYASESREHKSREVEFLFVIDRRHLQQRLWRYEDLE